jgi:TolB-like protein/DNA-binding winged helix-turn-helix (wHTH) protein/Tfp pilus assembly protein PilF
LLVERSGYLHDKSDLMASLWRDSFVEESNLTQHVWTLRKILGEGNDEARYIETVPKRGYRFTAEVRSVSRPVEHLVIEKQTLTRIVSEEEAETHLESKSQSPVGHLLLERRRTPFSRPLMIAIGLAGLLLFGGLVAALFGGSIFRRTKTADAATNSPIRSMAVLPFKSIGASKDNEYLGLGLTDSLIAKLGNIHQLVVRPTSAVVGYANSDEDPVTIGRLQGVDAVLAGNVQREADRLVLNVKLVRVADGSLLYSGHFDERFNNVFSVQDAISDQVSCDLVTRICGQGGEQLVKQAKISIEAYEAYLKGRYFWNKRTTEGFEKAIDYFNQAIALDPNFARAYAGLGDTYQFLAGTDRMPKDDAFSKSKAAAKKALELDPTLAEPHAALALIAMNHEWDWPITEREYKAAIELNPNYATAHHWYAEFLITQARFDESLAEIKRARELDPLSLIINSDMAKILYYSRRHDQAIEQLHKTLELEPNWAPAHFWLFMALNETGNYDEAIAELSRTGWPADSPGAIALHARTLIRAGRKGEADESVGKLNRIAAQRQVDPMDMLPIYIELGEKDRAFASLEKAYEGRSTAMTSLKVNPLYDRLRSDPRFTNRMRRVGL